MCSIQYLKLTLILSAVSNPSFTQANKNYVLIWNIADNTQPLAYLISPSPVTSADIQEYKGHLIVICGCMSGQVLVYDLDSVHSGIYEQFYK